MNTFARFDENPATTLQDIKETKRYGRTNGRTHGRTHTHARTDNVKTVYPTTNKVCGGYKHGHDVAHIFTIEFLQRNYRKMTLKFRNGHFVKLSPGIFLPF